MAVTLATFPQLMMEQFTSFVLTPLRELGARANPAERAPLETQFKNLRTEARALIQKAQTTYNTPATQRDAAAEELLRAVDTLNTHVADAFGDRDGAQRARTAVMAIDGMCTVLMSVQPVTADVAPALRAPGAGLLGLSEETQHYFMTHRIVEGLEKLVGPAGHCRLAVEVLDLIATSMKEDNFKSGDYEPESPEMHSCLVALVREKYAGTYTHSMLSAIAAWHVGNGDRPRPFTLDDIFVRGEDERPAFRLAFPLARLVQDCVLTLLLYRNAWQAADVQRRVDVVHYVGQFHYLFFNRSESGDAHKEVAGGLTVEEGRDAAEAHEAARDVPCPVCHRRGHARERCPRLVQIAIHKRLRMPSKIVHQNHCPHMAGAGKKAAGGQPHGPSTRPANKHNKARRNTGAKAGSQGGAGGKATGSGANTP